MIPISRTKKKKEAQTLITFSEKLLHLPMKKIESLDLPSEIYNAIKFAKTIKSHIALNREVKHIGGLFLKFYDEFEPEQQKALIKLGMIKMEKDETL